MRTLIVAHPLGEVMRLHPDGLTWVVFSQCLDIFFPSRSNFWAFLSPLEDAKYVNSTWHFLLGWKGQILPLWVIYYEHPLLLWQWLLPKGGLSSKWGIVYVWAGLSGYSTKAGTRFYLKYIFWLLSVQFVKQDEESQWNPCILVMMLVSPVPQIGLPAVEPPLVCTFLLWPKLHALAGPSLLHLKKHLTFTVQCSIRVGENWKYWIWPSLLDSVRTSGTVNLETISGRVNMSQLQRLGALVF